MRTRARQSVTHRRRACNISATPPPTHRTLLRSAVILSFITILTTAPSLIYSQDPPKPVAQQDKTTDDRGNAFRITGFRFLKLDNPGADLRTLDPDAAGTFLKTALSGNLESVEAAKQIFDKYSFEQIETLAKDPRIFPTEHKAGVAEARRAMIRQALEVSLGEFEAATGRVGKFELGALDSGNKGSGIGSDVDQTVFLIDRATGEVVSSQEINSYIERFNEVFKRLHGHPPERFGIESMNGADFFPDHRQAHNLLELALEAKRVVNGKRGNTEAYRSEGELKSQAEGRGYRALQEFGQELITLDESIKRLRSFPPEQLTVEQQRHLKVAEAKYASLIKLSPWTYVARDAGGKLVASTAEDPRLTKVLPVEPEMVERFAFDGAYDNWFMFENHPHNRPKYLLRSGAEGPFLLSRLRRSTGAEQGPAAVQYDNTANRKVVAYDYDTEYGRSNHDLNRQILKDTYGHLEGKGSALTVERIRKAYDAAAKFRLRHKGALRPDGQPYDIYDVYSEYMSTDARYPKQIRLQEAMLRWDVAAREIMIENLLLSVRVPGEVMEGKFSAQELSQIAAQVRRQAPDAPVHADALRLAAELQLYHGIHDLLSPEHARELRESDPAKRERLRQNRNTDLVDRLFAEAEKGTGGKAFRTELERIAREAAAARVNMDLNLQPHGKVEPSYVDVLRAEMGGRLARLEAKMAAYRPVAQRLRAGGYSQEVVSELLLEGLTKAQVVNSRFIGEATAHLLGVMGFKGAVVFPKGEYKLSNMKVEFGQPAFSSRQLLGNMFSAGSIYSGLTVLETAIESNNDPSEVAWAATKELILRLPGVMAGTALYEAFAHGRPEGASLLATSYFSPSIGHGFILASIGVMSVRLGGKLLLAGLEPDNADMIYQGYLAARKGGWVFDHGLRELMQSARDNLLQPVEIRVVPYQMTDPTGRVVRHPPEEVGFLTKPEGQPQTFWALAPFSVAEAKKLDFVSEPREYEWAMTQGLLGGGLDWEEHSPRARDQVVDPILNHHAKRASLFYHYEDAVDDYLCRRGRIIEPSQSCVHDGSTEKIETLVGTNTSERAAAALLPFFRDIVEDWIYRRDEFSDGDGGAAESLIDQIRPKDRLAERDAFLGKLAFRMTSDFLVSYQLIRDGAPGFPGEGSLEFGIQQNIKAKLADLARSAANQTMVALNEAQEAAIQPELAYAMHDVALDRRPTKGAPRIHVWPRVVNAESSAEAAAARSRDAEGAAQRAPPQKVEMILSVIANPDSFPPPYKADSLEFILAESVDGVHLSVRVTVRDANGKIVGEPVVKPVGTIEVDPVPGVLADPVVEACALAEDAPESFPAANAAEHCDASVKEILEYDRIALFLTPHRDLGGPDRKADDFVWRLDNPAGEELYEGFWASDAKPGPDAPTPTATTTEGAPARFVTFPDLWGPLRGGARTGPGTYTLRSAEAVSESGASVLGNPSSVDWLPKGLWQTEGAFDLAVAPGLHFKGFVMEPPVPKPLSGRGTWDGGWHGSIAPPEVTVAGSTVSLDLGASWQLWNDGLTGQPRLDSTRHRSRSRITLDFPSALAPGRDSSFVVGTKVEALETGIGLRKVPVTFAFELGFMLPTAGSPPDRHLLRGDELPTPWAILWQSDLGSVTQKGARTDLLNTTAPFASTAAGPITFRTHGWSRPSHRLGSFGAPARRLPWHLRDEKTIWVIPVVAHLTQADQVGRAILDPWAIVGYAIYGLQPGTYAGPLPKGDPVPPAEVIAFAGPDSTTTPPIAGGEVPEQPAGDSGFVAEPPPRDSVPPTSTGGANDPANPIGVVPPIGGKTVAEAGTALRKRGIKPRFVPGSMAPTPERSRTVESVKPPAGTSVGGGAEVEVAVHTDHIALSEVPRLTGRTVTDVRSRLVAAGLEMEPLVGDPAPSAGRSRTVQRQDPEPNAKVERGTRVKVWIHTDHIALTTVPELITANVEEAKGRADREGLILEPLQGEPALVPAHQGVVYRQDPPPGTEVEAGTRIKVWVHTEAMRPPTPDPRAEPLPPRPPIVAEPPRDPEPRREVEPSPPTERAGPDLPAGINYYWRLVRSIEGGATPACRSGCTYYARLDIFENRAAVFMGNQRSGADYLFRWNDPPDILIPGQTHPVGASGRLTDLRGWSGPADRYIDFQTEQLDRSGKATGVRWTQAGTHRRQVKRGQYEASGNLGLIGPKLDRSYPEFRLNVVMPNWAGHRSVNLATYIYRRIEVNPTRAAPPPSESASSESAFGHSRRGDTREADRESRPR